MANAIPVSFMSLDNAGTKVKAVSANPVSATVFEYAFAEGLLADSNLYPAIILIANLELQPSLTTPVGITADYGGLSCTVTAVRDDPAGNGYSPDDARVALVCVAHLAPGDVPSSNKFTITVPTVYTTSYSHGSDGVAAVALLVDSTGDTSATATGGVGTPWAFTSPSISYNAGDAVMATFWNSRSGYGVFQTSTPYSGLSRPGGTNSIGPVVAWRADTLAAGSFAPVWTETPTPHDTANNITFAISFRLKALDFSTPLSISPQPQSQTVDEGTAALFFAGAAGGTGTVHFQWKKNGVNVGTDSPVYQTPGTTFDGDDGAVYTVTATDDNGSVTSNDAVLTVVPFADFNCPDCEAESPYATLADLRVRMMRRLGYSAMATNPPPGMTELLTDFLTDAQIEIDKKRPDLRTKRIFKWTMIPGERFYRFSANESDCDVTFDPHKVDWVGVEDLNARWYPLIQGIPPEFYTTAVQPSLPQRYEFRSCIEVFPAPTAAYTLRIKGDFGLMAFVNPEHKTTIDDHVVFLLALANAKAHYKQKDAATVYQAYKDYLAGMVGSKHATARYIPQKKPVAPWVMPIMRDGWNW